MENETAPDPYEAVLADLHSKKQQIEQAISVIEGLRGTVVAATVSRDAQHIVPRAFASGPVPATGPGAFLGMTIHDATKKLLSSQRRQMQTVEIVAELERGGVVLTSADKVNTVGSILLRRFNTVGDIVRVARGVWGLQEWYPGRKFSSGKAKTEEPEKAEPEQQEPMSSENVQDTKPDSPTAGDAPFVVRPRPQIVE